MNAFEAYKEYVALKNHFTKPNYDYIKYNGSSRLKLDSFNKRKDKLFFEKLAKVENVSEFLIANFSDNSKLWIRDLAYSESCHVTYNDWKKKQQSLTYNFKRDFKKIVEEPKGDSHPAALRLYLGGDISLESLCIFVDMCNMLKTWDSKLEYDPVWEDTRMKIVKYIPFIKYDAVKIKKLMLDIMSDVEYTK